MSQVYNFSQASVTVRPLTQNSVAAPIRYARRIKEIKSRQGADGRLPGANLRAELRDLRKLLRKPKNIHYIAEVKLKKVNFLKDFTLEVRPGESIVRLLKPYINSTIQAYRRSLKPHPFEKKIKGRQFVFADQHVLHDPGQILKAYISKKVKDLYVAKTPQVENKYVGIEIEFCAPIREEELAVKLFRADLTKIVELKHDGSLRPKNGETGYELAILLTEQTYKKDLKRICDLLTSVGAKVTERRCGLHVHLDMRSRNRDLVYNNLVACQTVLLGIVDPSRTDNEFCRTVTSKKFPTSFTGERQERYKTINAAAYYKYKTLEVRMHEGSVNYEEISNWIDLLIKIANYKKKIGRNVGTLTALNKRMKLKSKTFKGLLDKTCYWQVNRLRPSISPTSIRERLNSLDAITATSTPSGLAAALSLNNN